MQRLFIDQKIEKEKNLFLEKPQIHYLFHVLRLKPGDFIEIFNGKNGEWRALIEVLDKKQAVLKPVKILREQAQDNGVDVYYCFALIKQARLDYIIQKAVELGATKIIAVKTEYTQIAKINRERIEANIIEAAEQSGALSIAKFSFFKSLSELLENWDYERLLIFCDEKENYNQILPSLLRQDYKKMAVLIGPEGGFSEKERRYLQSKDFVMPVSLGKRILRSDTAAVASLFTVNSVLFIKKEL